MRYDAMRAQMMDMFSQLASWPNMNQTPNYKTMLRLRDRMTWEGMPGEVADQVVAGMKISISERCFTDDELMRVAVETMAAKAAQLYEVVQRDFPTDPRAAFLSLARSFSLEMEF